MTIKKTTTGWCHAPASRYYSRIVNCVEYDDVWCCVYDGGGEHSRWNGDIPDIPVYKRQYFGWGWMDLDGDGQHERTEALILQNTGQLVFTDETERLVKRGQWRSVYTNDVLIDASIIDVDHIIPLNWAWMHGAWRWTYTERKAFANDQVNLFSVESSLNRAKGAQGPDTWLPPENVDMYILRWRRLLKKYNLRAVDAGL